MTETYIALLRGINVGGKNSLPMKVLTQLLENIGASGVQTYIQSGNVVFSYPSAQAGTLAQTIQSEIQKSSGFSPDVILLTAAQLETIIQNNPFTDAVQTPALLHVGFTVQESATPDFEKLDRLKIPSEQYRLIGNAFYLHTPEGFGRSKLAAGYEKALGVSVSDRNWNTVLKLQETIKRR